MNSLQTRLMRQVPHDKVSCETTKNAQLDKPAA